MLSCYGVNRRLETPLIDLVKSGAVKLYYRPTRGTHSHFVIVDDVKARVQAQHSPGESLHARAASTVVRKGSKTFRSCVTEFNLYTNSQCKNPRTRFLLIKKSELRELAEFCGKSFNRRTRDALERAVVQLQKQRKVLQNRVKRRARHWPTFRTELLAAMGAPQ